MSLSQPINGTVWRYVPEVRIEAIVSWICAGVMFSVRAMTGTGVRRSEFVVQGMETRLQGTRRVLQGLHQLPRPFGVPGIYRTLAIRDSGTQEI
jgi:hypothetical protein